MAAVHKLAEALTRRSSNEKLYIVDLATIGDDTTMTRKREKVAIGSNRLWSVEVVNRYGRIPGIVGMSYVIPESTKPDSPAGMYC